MGLEHSGAEFLDQENGEETKKPSEGQHSGSPLPAPSLASPGAPRVASAFSYKQARNHLLLKVGGGKDQIKKIQRLNC